MRGDTANPSPSLVPLPVQTGAKARGFSPTALESTAETDSPLEGTGFEPLVPRKPVILTRPFVEVDHLLPWAEAEPGQECRGKQRRNRPSGNRPARDPRSEPSR